MAEQYVEHVLVVELQALGVFREKFKNLLFHVFRLPRSDVYEKHPRIKIRIVKGESHKLVKALPCTVERSSYDAAVHRHFEQLVEWGLYDGIAVEVKHSFHVGWQQGAQLYPVPCRYGNISVPGKAVKIAFVDFQEIYCVCFFRFDFPKALFVFFAQSSVKYEEMDFGVNARAREHRGHYRGAVYGVIVVGGYGYVDFCHGFIGKLRSFLPGFGVLKEQGAQNNAA